jgi:phosphoserine aminotransferase
MVGRLRNGLSHLFSLPEDWEIVLGNGGSTLFWDAATFGLIENASQHLVFGEFSSKFAQAVAKAPHLQNPEIIESDPGDAPTLRKANVDTYALTHNETSTGVSIPITRVPDISANDALVLVDATSAAGGMLWDPSEVDCYYFAPQKCFGSDGGLWVAACSPAAIARIEKISLSDRWIPAGLDINTALDNSRKNQTYNTPALSTIFLTVHQVEWMNNNGGLNWAAERSRRSSSHIYDWADHHQFASPFVENVNLRSPVVATIDLAEEVNADVVIEICRENGILDIAGYRKLGRNQLRIATFPAIELEDVHSLTKSLDYVIGSLL